jgi:hypothetical protein
MRLDDEYFYHILAKLANLKNFNVFQELELPSPRVELGDRGKDILILRS